MSWKSRIGSTLLLTIAVLGALYFLLSRNDYRFSEVRESLGRVDLRIVGLILIFGCIQVAVQATRLYVLARAVSQIRFLAVLRLHAFGQVLNAFLPARVGDAYKVTRILASEGKAEAQSIGRAVGVVFVADKLADLAATVSLALVFAPLVIEDMTESAHFMEVSRLYGPWVVALGMTLALAAFLSRRFHGVFGTIRQILETVFVKISINKYLLACILAVASFAVECGALSILVNSSVDVEITFFEALWVMILVNIGIAVPITFANLGAFEAAMTFGLSRLGVPIETGLAISLVHHGVQLTSTLTISALTAGVTGLAKIAEPSRSTG